MKRFLIPIVLLVFYAAQPVIAQPPFQVELLETGTTLWALDAPMDSMCGDTGHPIADGVTVYILQDRDGDGPCYADSLVTLCDNPPYCISGLPPGSVNFNELVFNSNTEFAMPGYFMSTALPNYGYFTMVGNSPYPSRFFLLFWVRVGVSWQVFVSEVFSPPPGISSYEISNWSCLEDAEWCHNPPAAPMNVSATDCTSCFSVTVRWSYADGEPPVPVDSFFIYRDGIPIGHVPRQDSSYMDYSAPDGRHSYYVKSRRAPLTWCSLFTCTASAADSGSVYPHAAATDSFSASDDSCGFVRVAWNYRNHSSTDSFIIQRNGVTIAGMRAVGEPGLRSFDHYTIESERGGYQVIGWNSVCGEGAPSAVDSGGIALPITETPENIIASTTYCSWITVSWNSVPHARSYRIYRRSVDSVYAFIAEVTGSPLVTVYSDQGVAPLEVYEYKVQAANACGIGLMSEESASGFRQDVPDTETVVNATDGNFEDYVQITWGDLNRETGYHIYRDETLIGIVSNDVFTFNDWNAQRGHIHVYRVCGYNTCGIGVCGNPDSGYRGTLSSTHLNPDLPDRFALHPNYPNPFNPITQIAFDLPRASHIMLRVYDALGRQVTVLASGSLPAGKHTVFFDGRNLPSGIYICRMQTEETDLEIKMLLLK